MKSREFVILTKSLFLQRCVWVAKTITSECKMSREISDWMRLFQLIHTCTHTK